MQRKGTKCSRDTLTHFDSTIGSGCLIDPITRRQHSSATQNTFQTNKPGRTPPSFKGHNQQLFPLSVHPIIFSRNLSLVNKQGQMSSTMSHTQDDGLPCLVLFYSVRSDIRLLKMWYFSLRSESPTKSLDSNSQFLMSFHSPSLNDVIVFSYMSKVKSRKKKNPLTLPSTGVLSVWATVQLESVQTGLCHKDTEKQRILQCSELANIWYFARKCPFIVFSVYFYGGTIISGFLSLMCYCISSIWPSFVTSYSV